MNMNRHNSQDDLALFALQLLEGEELQDVLAHLEHCEECRHEVARFQGDLVGYALAQSELHTPPAAARDRLMKAVGKEKKIVRDLPATPVVPMAATPLKQDSRTTASAPPAEVRSETRSESRTDTRVADGDVFLAARARRTFAMDSPEEEEERAPRRSSAGSFLGWAGWAIAAGLAVTAGLEYRDRQGLQSDLAAANSKAAHSADALASASETLQTLTGAGAMQVSLHLNSKAAPEPEGHVSYVADKGALVFVGNHLQPLQPYKTYELWLIPADGKDPMPAGTFKPDVHGVATVVMPELPKGVAAQMFGVTIEDDGGSKTPTAPIVLASEKLGE